MKGNYVDVKIEGTMTHALVDSGASYSVVSDRFRLKLRNIMLAETDVSLRVANGKVIKSKGRCTLKLGLNGLLENFGFIVLEDYSHDRFCVYYRSLNKITKNDVYPLPRIDDTIDCLRGARFYSSMDLQSGYWQTGVEESDSGKTEFITPDRLYEFKVMPFGLCNAPDTFKRMMDNLLKGLKNPVYVLIPRNLSLVQNLSPSLGHEVSENCIHPNPEKMRTVREFATPRVVGSLGGHQINPAAELPDSTTISAPSHSGGTSGSAGQEPGRPSIPSPTGVKYSNKNEIQKIIIKENSENRIHANLPAGVKDVNLAATRDVTLNLPAGFGPGADDDFTVVKTEKRRRESSNSPTAAAPSSNSGGARSSRRMQSSARSVPRAQEISTTRVHIAEARARQTSSAEEHCVYLEHGPKLQPFHYLRALDKLLGGTAGVVQVSKVNGHQLLGLANRGLAERLINSGLEVEGTLLRAFPFRKRAERITVGNLPFFVEDSAIIKALGPYGRITSIAPKMMKAGPYTYTDGRREAFIVLHEGVTTERLPTRLNITIKGEAWPAYLSSGIKCSRCHGQGHRRANCPLLAGQTTAPGPATPTSPTSVPPATTPRLPQQPSAQPPPPASPSPAMEVSDVPPTSRAALHPPAALRQSPPAPSVLPAEDAPPAPPPVTPAPSLRAPGRHGPAAPTPDIEMSIAEETSTSSTSSSKTSTREGIVTFIERNPGVSFAGTDALGLGREEVLDLLSPKTRARKQGPLLSPPQSDALAGLIGQLLNLRPGGSSNIYKVLGQVKAELRTALAAVPPTPPMPAPRPAGPTPPAPHGDTTTPAVATPPPPLSAQMERVLMDKRWKLAGDFILELSREIDLEHTFQSQVDVDDIVKAILYPGDREPLLKRLPTRDRYIFGGFISTAIRRARDLDPFRPTTLSAQIDNVQTHPFICDLYLGEVVRAANYLISLLGFTLGLSTSSLTHTSPYSTTNNENTGLCQLGLTHLTPTSTASFPDLTQTWNFLVSAWTDPPHSNIYGQLPRLDPNNELFGLTWTDPPHSNIYGQLPRLYSNMEFLVSAWTDPPHSNIYGQLPRLDPNMELFSLSLDWPTSLQHLRPASQT
ncbi:K02A2.6-like [Cordylochernes scorpioides]|uniref:K02A2.6-like n=1 Tax=Cordylochernes scorpioides TaxID=51811 RepID=A0ABY6LJQ4_9ARAC|nr:K02A2.6-like [Cordylochernes scorpioides]